MLSDDKLLVKFSNYVETGHLLKEAFGSQDTASSEDEDFPQQNIVSFGMQKIRALEKVYSIPDHFFRWLLL